MFSNALREKKNEQLGLLSAAAIFALMGMVQLWRVFAGASVELGGRSIPIWLSVVVGVAALLMSLLMGLISRPNRPVP
jgi:hypothetical protein